MSANYVSYATAWAEDAIERKVVAEAPVEPAGDLKRREEDVPTVSRNGRKISIIRWD